MSLSWKFSKGSLIFEHDNGTRITGWSISTDATEDEILNKLRDIVSTASPEPAIDPVITTSAPRSHIPTTPPPGVMMPSMPHKPEVVPQGVPWNSGNVDDLPIM